MQKMLSPGGLILGLLIVSCDGPSVKYFTDLRINHSSPWYPIVGVHEITADDAKNLDHYVFYFGEDSKLDKIVNNFDVRKKKHSHELTHLDWVKTVKFTYSGKIETREFFDDKGQPAKNMKSVFKEVYTYNDAGDLVKLEFFDLENKSMESNWLVSRYEWTKNGQMVVEKRYNKDNIAAPIAPYFQMGLITGLVQDGRGNPKETINLDDSLKPSPGIGDISSYRDYFDENNFMTKIEYHRVDGSLTSALGFAYRVLSYDKNGYMIQDEAFDSAGTSLSKTNF